MKWKKYVKESDYDMSENVKQWFADLYTDAIKETKAALSNERIWQNGADDYEEIEMHEENILELEEYLEILQEKLDELG